MDDPYRPEYHFFPPANWMNDPNGVIQWKGQYHLFYQYNPHGAFWGTIHWGHAVSPDLVHWTDLPIALAPTPGGPDEGGCWSGCAVDDGGIPTIIYTGAHPQRPCVATSRDDLFTWEKYPGNPVISAPPEGLDVVGFRDHSVWQEADTWYQVIGSGLRDVGGAALLYRSPDLIDWEYLNPLLVGDEDQADPVWTGTMWECPDFFSAGDKYVLVVSALDTEGNQDPYTLYFVGTYVDHTFAPEVVRRLDFGDALFYAPQTFVDERGRRIMWGWVKEGRSDESQRAAGWAGVMALPRVLSLRPDGFLGFQPAPELEMLRGEHRRVIDVAVMPTSAVPLDDVRGDCLEIIAEFEPGDAEEFGLTVCRAPDGVEETRILYDAVGRRLIVDRERSSLSHDVDSGMHEGLLDLALDEPLSLHVFLDRSVVEVYANGRACLTSRIYPSRPDSLGLALFARGGTANLTSLDVWQLTSIWPRTTPRPLP